MKVFYQIPQLGKPIARLAVALSFWFFSFLPKGIYGHVGHNTKTAETEHSHVALSPSAPLEDLVLEQWGVAEGLPSDLINDLEISRYGYLYLATYSGLARFDGVGFKLTNSDDWKGLVGGVTALAEDDSGALWIGANGGGVNRLQNGKWSVWDTDHGLPSAHVDVLHIDSRDNLWIGTKAGLCRMTIGSDLIERLPLSEGEDMVRLIFEDSTGFIWVGMHSQGLFKLDVNGKVVSHFADIPGIDDLQVLSIAEDGFGVVWVGTTDGLARYENEIWTSYSINDGLSGNTVSSLLYDPGSGLWILTEGGLSRFREGAFSTLSSLEDRSVLVGDIALDREQSLWIGTWKGLFRVRSSLFGVIDEDDGLGGTAVNFVYEDDYGIIYFGGSGFLNSQSSEGELFSIHPDVFGDVVVRDCLVDPQGRIWVMTHNGVYLLDGEEVVHFTTEDGLKSNLARDCWMDQSGKLWVATMGGISFFQDGEWHSLEKENESFSGGAFISLTADSRGRLWFTTDSGGIHIWDHEKMTVLRKADGLPSDLAFRLSEDIEGNMWVATNNGLACVFSNGEIGVLSTADGLPDAVILQALVDPQDQIWLLTNFGIYVGSRHDVLNKMQGGDAEIRFRHLTIFDGLPDEGLAPGASQSIVDSRGRLWLSSWNGIAYLDTGDIATNPYPPLTQISSLQVDELIWEGSSLNGETLVLEPNPRKVTISFSAMGLRSPAQTYVEAYLEGFDTDWTAMGSARSVTYTNLNPGTYTFKLRAENEDRISGLEVAELEIQILPAWSERLGFWFSLFLVVFLFVAGLVWLRLRHIRKRNLQLEALVKQRTQELEKQALELRASHAELDRSFEALKEVSNEKSEILGIAAHDMKNPIGGILGLSELLDEWMLELDRDVYELEEARDLVKTMHSSAQHLIHIIDGLLMNAMVDEGKVPLEFGEYDLYLLAKEVTQLNSMQARNKGIELILQGSEGSKARVDPQRFREILDNLISNAVKYSNTSSKVHIFLNLVDDQIHFQVKDQGPGLTEGDFGKLFKKFQKLSAKPTAGERSTGLGLSIAKRMTDDMGGRIWAENNADGGASFFLEFPLF